MWDWLTPDESESLGRVRLVGGARRSVSTKIVGVHSHDRVMLIDVENAVGSQSPRACLVRARVTALMRAAGPVHHALACYSHADPAGDSVLSVLAELGVASWLVPPGPDAAETALLAHARYVHERGCRTFSVASADHQFAALAELGEFDVLAWTGQPVSQRLTKHARTVRRVPRPAADAAPGTTDPDQAQPGITPDPVEPPTQRGALAGQAVTALITGVGIGIGAQLTKAITSAVHRGLRR